MLFLNKTPALLIATFALLGFFIPLYPFLSFPTLFLITLYPHFPKRGQQAFFLAVPLSLLAGLFSFLSLPKIATDELKGTFHFAIDEIRESKTAFGKGVLYKGHIVAIESPQLKINFCRLPCSLYLSKKKEIYPDKVIIEGTLAMKTPYFARLKPHLKTPWIPNSSTFFAEGRFLLKKKLARFIESKFSFPDTKKLITGLVTGNFDDFLVSQEFSRLGLSHLMAISGFHFSLVANVLSLFCINFFKRKTATLLLYFFLSSYFLFLGAQASVLRAWTMILIALGEHFVEKKSEPLNSLGISCLLILLINPTEILRPAFWLSYGITASILLFSSPCQALLDFVFKKRSHEEVLALTPLNQWGYFALSFLKKGIALNLAVTIFALPLTLFFFHRFPWISLFTNLLFPPLVGISLLLFLLSILLFPLSKTIDFINDYFTHALLSLMTNIPLKVDFVLRVSSMEVIILAYILIPLLLIGLYLKNRVDKFFLYQNQISF